MFASLGLKANGKVFARFVTGTFVTTLLKERVDDLVAPREPTSILGAAD